MNETDAPNSGGGTAAVVLVAVVRSGGMAGIRRRWEVEPASDETPRWVALIERCPWDDPSETNSGADRYMWSVHVRTDREERERELPDSQLHGAWRELVDAVRDAATADDPASPG